MQSYLEEGFSNEIETTHEQDQLISFQQEIDQLTIQLNNLRLENGQAGRTVREVYLFKYYIFIIVFFSVFVFSQ